MVLQIVFTTTQNFIPEIITAIILFFISLWLIANTPFQVAGIFIGMAMIFVVVTILNRTKIFGLVG